MAQRTIHTQTRAFTLLELTLALLIIGLVVALAAPSLRGWSRAARLRDAADQMLALTRLARSQAVTDACTYRLNVDVSAGKYWLSRQDNGQQLRLGTGWGQDFYIPADTQIELLDSSGRRTSFLEFYSNGGVQPGKMRISDGRDVIEIVCESPAENFRISTAKERT